jgi:predicted acylesterase/phospholipase RssA
VRLSERFATTRPIEEMECALVRAVVADPGLLSAVEEATLRTALGLARIYRVRHEGRDVGVGAALAPWREEILRRVGPVLRRKTPPRRDELLPLARDLRDATRRERDALLARHAHRLPREALLRELTHKSLVVVAGGGGGSGYVYLGALSLLEEHGLRPALLAGTSMGAILSLFRARAPHFDQADIVNIVRGLSWRKLFRVVSTENRYGLPAALRLYLRAGIGRFFRSGPGEPGTRLGELPVPTLVSVSGIRRGMLPRPLEFYEQLLGPSPLSLANPVALAGRVQLALSALSELFNRPEVMVKLHLGVDAHTRDFDALDAAGFSSALPGIIHYDVLRDDARMRAQLDGIFEEKQLFRLVDGGLTDNLPAKAAWRAVQKGAIGTRNCFVLALNGFSMKLTTPLWLPLQRLAELTAAPNRPYAHLVKDFRRTLSPLELVPSVEQATAALHLGRRQLAEDMPFLVRMMAPVPVVP